MNRQDQAGSTLARLIGIVAVGILLLYSFQVRAQTHEMYDVQFDHLVLETLTPDSVLRAFNGLGFRTVYDRSRQHTRVDTVFMSTSGWIAVVERYRSDADPRFDSSTSFYSMLCFRVSRGSGVKDSVSLPFGNPLILQVDFDPHTSRQPDGLSENSVSWIVLTAGTRITAELIEQFAQLGFRKQHQGCCDYWLTGPPENRIAIRFDIDHLPSDPNALSIGVQGIVTSR